MASKVKPGTPHPNRGGMVMGMNNRYVSKGTYAKQKKASKPAPSKKVTPKTTPKSSSSTPKVGATKRLQGRMVRWNGKRWTAAGTGPKKPTPTPRKASATPKPPTGRFTAPKVPKAKVAPTAASRIVKAAKRAASSPAARNTLKILGKTGQLISGDGSGQALMGAVTASNLIDAARGSTAKERNANKPKTKPKPSRVTSNQKTNRRGRVVGSKKPSVKPARRGMSNIPPGEGTGKGSPNDKKPASTTKASTTKSSTRSSKPKVKKKSSVSGVGPVKSGRRYSVDVSGKSVSRQNVDQLRKMGPNSERSKKLREEAKQKSLAQGKKNRERNKRRRFGRG